MSRGSDALTQPHRLRRQRKEDEVPRHWVLHELLRHGVARSLGELAIDADQMIECAREIPGEQVSHAHGSKANRLPEVLRVGIALGAACNLFEPSLMPSPGGLDDARPPELGACLRRGRKLTDVPALVTGTQRTEE